MSGTLLRLGMLAVSGIIVRRIAALAGPTVDGRAAGTRKTQRRQGGGNGRLGEAFAEHEADFGFRLPVQRTDAASRAAGIARNEKRRQTGPKVDDRMYDQWRPGSRRAIVGSIRPPDRSPEPTGGRNQQARKIARQALIALACLAGIPMLLCAEEVTFRWNEIPQSLVASRKVEVRLAGGAVLRGKAVAMMPEGLRMEITKVDEGGGKFQIGESLVPASEITMMKVNRTGTRGRIIGTVIGGGISAAIIGIVYGLGLSNIEGTSASPGVAVAALVPTGVGYLLGWARDRRTTTIHVQA